MPSSTRQPTAKFLCGGQHKQGRVDIEVLDGGPGVPEALHDKIFERFFRYHTGKVLGSGLGLTIARECAGQMSASLTLQTPESGQGLCVLISFPEGAA